MARGGNSKTIARRGLMLVLSSPSGAGKTTLSRKLLAQESGIDLSISVTTRPKRRGEVNGRLAVVAVACRRVQESGNGIPGPTYRRGRRNRQNAWKLGWEGAQVLGAAFAADRITGDT